MTTLLETRLPVDSRRDELVKSTCCLCGQTVPPALRGWGATCDPCESLLARGYRPSEVSLIREPVPTVEDWQDYAEAARAIDEAWLADQAEAEAWLDQPDPTTEVDLAAEDRAWERRFAAVRDAFEFTGYASEGR